MIEKKVEEITITQEVIQAVVCNCCGKREVIVDGLDLTDVTPIMVDFGYGSKFDTEHWTMDICDECMDAWTSTFKHPPQKKSD